MTRVQNITNRMCLYPVIIIGCETCAIPHVLCYMYILYVFRFPPPIVFLQQLKKALLVSVHQYYFVQFKWLWASTLLIHNFLKFFFFQFLCRKVVNQQKHICKKYIKQKLLGRFEIVKHFVTCNLFDFVSFIY